MAISKSDGSHYQRVTSLNPPLQTVLQHLPRPAGRRTWLRRPRGPRARRGAGPFARQPRPRQRRHQGVGGRGLAQTRQTLAKLLLEILLQLWQVIHLVIYLMLIYLELPVVGDISIAGDISIVAMVFVGDISIFNYS